MRTDSSGSAHLILMGSGSFGGATTSDLGSTTLLKPIRRARLRRSILDLSDGLRSSASADDSPRSPTRLVGRRVLLVEDNFINQEVAFGMLELLGCEVTMAENGVHGVAEFERGKFDAVLLDCQMPEMDGYEAAERMRAFESKRGGGRTPIIALTANAFASDRERCLTAGMDDFLSKPIERAVLTERLELWLAHPHGAAGPAEERG